MSSTMVELKEITYPNLSKILLAKGGGGDYGIADGGVFYIYVVQKNIISVPPPPPPPRI